MSDTQGLAEKLQGKPLTEREHQDPDKHWIGESIAVPTQTEIAATIGSVSGVGDSPFVARADHMHKIDPALLPVYSSYTPTISNCPLGTGGTVVGQWFAIRLQPSLRWFFVQVTIVFGTGTSGTTVGPTGDMSISFPVNATSQYRSVGRVLFEASGRFTGSWTNISAANGTGGIIRPDIFRPTVTDATRVIEVGSVAMNAILPVQDWNNAWLTANISYFSAT